MNDLRTIFIGEDNPWIFLMECALRAALMFVLVLALMKLSGKKEVRQFSVLELLVIIGLGSALGDPMIYTEAPILPSLVAIATVLFCYWAMNKWTNRAPKVERFIEGEVRRVLHNGILDLEALDAEGLSVSELFGDLRGMHVEHLGQVRSAYVEISGEVSVFFHADADVRPGLPLAPEARSAGAPLSSMGSFPCCCTRCGYLVSDTREQNCPHCAGDAWVEALSCKRVA